MLNVGSIVCVDDGLEATIVEYKEKYEMYLVEFANGAQELCDESQLVEIED